MKIIDLIKHKKNVEHRNFTDLTKFLFFAIGSAEENDIQECIDEVFPDNLSKEEQYKVGKHMYLYMSAFDLSIKHWEALLINKNMVHAAASLIHEAVKRPEIDFQKVFRIAAHQWPSHIEKELNKAFKPPLYLFKKCFHLNDKTQAFFIYENVFLAKNPHASFNGNKSVFDYEVNCFLKEEKEQIERDKKILEPRKDEVEGLFQVVFIQHMQRFTQYMKEGYPLSLDTNNSLLEHLNLVRPEKKQAVIENMVNLISFLENNHIKANEKPAKIRKKIKTL